MLSVTVLTVVMLSVMAPTGLEVIKVKGSPLMFDI